jgi:hypothetical protein
MAEVTNEAVVEVEGLRRSYGELEAARDVSFLMLWLVIASLLAAPFSPETAHRLRSRILRVSG